MLRLLRMYCFVLCDNFNIWSHLPWIRHFSNCAVEKYDQLYLVHVHQHIPKLSLQLAHCLLTKQVAQYNGESSTKAFFICLICKLEKVYSTSNENVQSCVIFSKGICGSSVGRLTNNGSCKSVEVVEGLWSGCWGSGDCFWVVLLRFTWQGLKLAETLWVFILSWEKRSKWNFMCNVLPGIN